uniref:Reverse transcriptase domain-containing protein n=1 Tax=Caenorhabditis tropicalis TaxID=1561998 RepID=A0A1I7UGF9_9PELO
MPSKKDSSEKRTMREIIETLWNMELSELESSLEAIKDIAKAAKQGVSENTNPLPPINLEYTAVEVPLYSSDNGNGMPNPQVHEKPKFVEDTEYVVPKAASAPSDEVSVDDKICKQKLRVDVKFILQNHSEPDEEAVDKFLVAYEDHIEQKEERKKLWKPYEVG